jgi:hypothetical protein
VLADVLDALVHALNGLGPICRTEAKQIILRADAIQNRHPWHSGWVVDRAVGHNFFSEQAIFLHKTDGQALARNKPPLLVISAISIFIPLSFIPIPFPLSNAPNQKYIVGKYKASKGKSPTPKTCVHPYV